MNRTTSAPLYISQENTDNLVSEHLKLVLYLGLDSHLDILHSHSEWEPLKLDLTYFVSI